MSANAEEAVLLWLAKYIEAADQSRQFIDAMKGIRQHLPMEDKP